MIKDSYLRIILICTLTFLVSGCGGTWQHAYKGEATFNAESNSCQAQANRAYPQPQSVSSSALEVAQLEPGRASVELSKQAGRGVVDGFMNDARERMVRDCMKSKGWYFVGYTTKIGNKNFNLTNGWLSWD